MSEPAPQPNQEQLQQIAKLQEENAKLREEIEQTRRVHRGLFGGLKRLWWWLWTSNVEETADTLQDRLKAWQGREKDEDGEPVRFPAQEGVLFSLSVLRRYRQFTGLWIAVVAVPAMLGCILSVTQSGLMLWSNMQTRDALSVQNKQVEQTQEALKVQNKQVAQTQEAQKLQANESSRARRAQVLGTLYNQIPGCTPVVCSDELKAGGKDPSCVPKHCLQESLRAREEACVVYAEIGHSENRPIKLEKVNLNGANLMYADLRNANLIYADLSGANLISANLNFANLSDANLHSAFLNYANLWDADLSSANLISAKLKFADLSSANLIYANLHSAKLSYANFHSAYLLSADLRNANLRKAYLKNAHLRKAKYNSKTKWPKGFDPTDPHHGLILIED